jgi:hypothetical protein
MPEQFFVDPLSGRTVLSARWTLDRRHAEIWVGGNREGLLDAPAVDDLTIQLEPGHRATVRVIPSAFGEVLEVRRDGRLLVPSEIRSKPARRRPWRTRSTERAS